MYQNFVKMTPSSKADKKAAVDIAAWIFNIVTSVGIIIVNKALMVAYGFTFGSQLFLTDGKPYRPPLLLRMTTDCEEADFISALDAFKYRILYANESYDHMVGRRTSSIRVESELVKALETQAQVRKWARSNEKNHE